VKKLKKLPKFKSDKDEFAFWETHDAAEYIDYWKTKK
jgi:hypothetical protein